MTYQFHFIDNRDNFNVIDIFAENKVNAYKLFIKEYAFDCKKVISCIKI